MPRDNRNIGPDTLHWSSGGNWGIHLRVIVRCVHPIKGKPQEVTGFSAAITMRYHHCCNDCARWTDGNVPTGGCISERVTMRKYTNCKGIRRQFHDLALLAEDLVVAQVSWDNRDNRAFSPTTIVQKSGPLGGHLSTCRYPAVSKVPCGFCSVPPFP